MTVFSQATTEVPKTSWVVFQGKFIPGCYIKKTDEEMKNIQALFKKALNECGIKKKLRFIHLDIPMLRIYSKMV